MAEPLHVGVTGTRCPLPDLQRTGLAGVLSLITAGHEGEMLVLHHGCCLNADATAHRIVRNLGGWTIHGHPGHDANGDSPWRAWVLMGDCDVLHAPLPYGSRNEDITIASGELVAVPAFPEGHRKSQRSGTWMTVRMARERDRRITLVWPDGTVTREPGKDQPGSKENGDA